MLRSLQPLLAELAKCQISAQCFVRMYVQELYTYSEAAQVLISLVCEERGVTTPKTYDWHSYGTFQYLLYVLCFLKKYWKILSFNFQNAQTKFQLFLMSTFWNFHENCLESVLGRKSHFLATFDSNFKIWKSFRHFLVKSTSECYFWLGNKVSTDCNEYFLKFSWKVFRISFRPKKSLLGHFWFKL